MTLIPGRRQTLGTINSNVPTRPAVLGQKRASLAPRLSMASSGRRLSMFNGGRSVIAADPRPITNKAFQQDNIRALIKFLTLHQYDREISPKILFAPTRNDVLHIATFLFRHVDPNFSFDVNSQSLSEEFPVFFETALAYPFKISKRSLQSVGSPHTWPPLLAALVWLIDLITKRESLEQEQIKDPALASALSEKVFYEYLASGYMKFLAGDDNFSFMESALANQFKERNAQIQDESSEIQNEIRTVKQEILSLQSSRSQLAEAQERRRSLAVDVEKYEKLRDELLEYKAGLMKERRALDEEAASCDSQINDAKAELANFQEQLSKQELSPADVTRIQNEQQSLQQNLDKLQNECEQASQKCWNAEANLVRLQNEITRAAEEYNEICIRVGLLPLNDCRYGHGIDYELKLNLEGNTVDDILSGTDMKRVVKSALVKLKQSFNKTLRKQAAEKRRAQEQLTTTTDQRTERADELKQLQNRLTKLDVSYREHREQKNEELKQRLAKLEDLELSTQLLEKSQGTALLESEEELQQAKAAVTRAGCTCNEESDAAIAVVMSNLNQLAAHQVYIGNQLEILEDLSSTYLD